MSHVQFITTPGARLAVIPEEEYRRLVAAFEDAQDAATIDEYRRKKAAGEAGEAVPMEMMKRLLDGESPVRVYREHRGMTAVQLAGKAGLSQGFISQIENGRREGSVQVLKSIAEALGVDLDDLVP